MRWCCNRGVCFPQIGDTSTYATFINSWAATARGAAADCPSFDSQSLFPIVGPDVKDEHNSSDEEGNEHLVSKRLVFDGEKVTALRERIGDTLTTFKYPTRIEAVSSLIWKSAVEADIATPPKQPPAKDQKSEPVSEMHIIVNLRKRMDPPLADSSFGNIFSMTTAKASVSRGAVDLNDSAGQIRVAISRIDDDHVKRMQNDEDSKEEYDRFRIAVSQMDSGYNYWLMSWCNFPLYEIDFGFGKPNWVTTDAVEVLEENDIFLMDTSIGNGVEAWIKLEQEKMNMFLSNQESLCSCVLFFLLFLFVVFV
ncbi:hypothetical protein MKX03_006101 [Papaver bracteatum]|nr:hypothetical protein MKX03_006101 [Papaver bracteatum]